MTLSCHNTLKTSQFIKVRYPVHIKGSTGRAVLSTTTLLSSYSWFSVPAQSYTEDHTWLTISQLCTLWWMHSKNLRAHSFPKTQTGFSWDSPLSLSSWLHCLSTTTGPPHVERWAVQRHTAPFLKSHDFQKPERILRALLHLNFPLRLGTGSCHQLYPHFPHQESSGY